MKHHCFIHKHNTCFKHKTAYSSDSPNGSQDSLGQDFIARGEWGVIELGTTILELGTDAIILEWSTQTALHTS